MRSGDACVMSVRRDAGHVLYLRRISRQNRQETMTTIRDGLAFFLSVSPIIEVRALKTKDGTLSGYFNDLDAAEAEVTRAVTKYNGTGNFYVTVNPPLAALLARSHNTLTTRAKETTADKEITDRRWFLLDFDPERPTNIASTDEELQHAVDLREKVTAWLTLKGWPAPVFAFSGNGAHSLYRIQLPNDKKTTLLLQHALSTIAQEFSTQHVNIDTSVFNAARIWRLYGTVNHKGHALADRPHRLSTLTSVPLPLLCVTAEQLDGLLPSVAKPAQPAAVLDLLGAFKSRQLYVRDFGNGKHAVVCPWKAAHTSDSGPSQTVLYDPTSPDVTSGGWGFECKHQHCAKRTIRDVRLIFGLEKPSYPLSDTGDAEFFAAKYIGRVAYDARRDRWLLLDQVGIWAPDPVDRLRSYAVDAMRDRQEQATKINDPDDRKKSWNWAFGGESSKRLTSMLREARTQHTIRNDSELEPWDVNPWLLGTPAGVVDLRTGESRKARPDERVTMRTKIEYDPHASSPLWERALLDIFEGNIELIQFLQVAGGYSITGDTKQDKWFLSHGVHGREGKGTIYGAWAAALGDYVLELPSAVFDLTNRNEPYNLAYLPGKRFVTSSESGNTVRLNHDRVKHLTGGDAMRVANKYERSFEFVPCCKLWLACNDLPQVTDDSSAFWARVVVIPFRRTFLGAENRDLRPALRQDPVHQRAVLAWLVRGAVAYAHLGLQAMPSAVEEATSAFRDVSWPLSAFVKEDCVIDPSLSVAVGDLNRAYQRFCERQGAPAEKRLGWKRVLKLMEARYRTEDVDRYEDGVRIRGKFYVGIRLREPVLDALANGDPSQF